MNDDSDGSEYVDHEDDLTNARQTRTRSRKNANSSKKRDGKDQEDSPEPATVSRQRSAGLRTTGNDVPEPRQHVLRAYQKILNTCIENVFESDDMQGRSSIGPSQIGASFWNTQEKLKFFSVLKSCGKGDLRALSATVVTKSEAEIKAFLGLLEDGVREQESDSWKYAWKFGLEEVPAAAEIGVECLKAEEAAARALEAKVRVTEEESDQVKWGEDRWLIDEDAAAAIEEQYEDANRAAKKSDDADEAGATPQPRADGKSASPELDEDEAQPRERISSEQLLNPSTMLQLSRTVFMNSPNPEMNWHTIAEDEDFTTSPAIRRTAFEDLHNLTVSLTRRLVQASIFQALSRLRASNDQRHAPAVNANDIEAARDIMNMKVNRAKYWSAAVKRSGVGVYSDAKKLRGDSTRRGTKTGFKLTEEELKEKLGLPVLRPAAGLEKSDDDEDEDEPDSDAYTLTSSSSRSEDEASEPDSDINSGDNNNSNNSNNEDKSANKDESANENETNPPTTSKRTLSPTSRDRADKRYLDSLDRVTSTAEENRLRKVLGLEPLPRAQQPEPLAIGKRIRAEPHVSEWRDAVQYEAPWEQPAGQPRAEDFEAMDAEGARRRKRRRLLREKAAEEGTIDCANGALEEDELEPLVESEGEGAKDGETEDEDDELDESEEDSSED